MSGTGKTAAEHVTDVLAQLKEMRHYSRNNVEALTAAWMLFDGELSKLGQAEGIDDLMTRQAELHAAFESVIADLEKLVVELQPPPEGA